MVKLAITDKEILNCFEVMAELRPHLIKDTFLNTVRSMEVDGYKLAYTEVNESIATVAGFRICTNLFMGKHLYIDDLVTSVNFRSLGHGKKMILWLREVAVKNECNYFHLDSGTHRDQAHKFYFEQGFAISSFHFSEQLNKR